MLFSCVSPLSMVSCHKPKNISRSSNSFGIQQGMIALTMSDLVDEEMIELALLDIEELIEGQFFGRCPHHCYRCRSKPIGIEELEQRLDRIHVESQSDDLSTISSICRSLFCPKRLWGCRYGHSARTSDENRRYIGVFLIFKKDEFDRFSIMVQSKNKHSLEREQPSTSSGIEKEQIQRGTYCINRTAFHPTSILDIEYHHLSDAPNLKDGARVRFLHGAMEVLHASPSSQIKTTLKKENSSFNCEPKNQ